MKSYSFATGAAVAILYACLSAPAEAARCPQGYIYRPSKHVCQYKGHRVRYAKRHHKRVAIKRQPKPIETKNYPQPRPPWSEPTPAWYISDVTEIAASPFGTLLPLNKVDP